MKKLRFLLALFIGVNVAFSTVASTDNPAGSLTDSFINMITSNEVLPLAGLVIGAGFVLYRLAGSHYKYLIDKKAKEAAAQQLWIKKTNAPFDFWIQEAKLTKSLAAQQQIVHNLYFNLDKLTKLAEQYKEATQYLNLTTAQYKDKIELDKYNIEQIQLIRSKVDAAVKELAESLETSEQVLKTLSPWAKKVNAEVDFWIEEAGWSNSFAAKQQIIHNLYLWLDKLTAQNQDRIEEIQMIRSKVDNDVKRLAETFNTSEDILKNPPQWVKEWKSKKN